MKWPEITWIDTKVINWNENTANREKYTLDEPQVRTWRLWSAV